LAEAPRPEPSVPEVPRGPALDDAPEPVPEEAARPGPPAAVAAAPPANAAPPRLWRPRNFTEFDLRDQLSRVPEVGLTGADVVPLVQGYHAQFQQVGGPNFEPGALLAQRPDLGELPVRSGKACHISDKAAAELQLLSQKLHAHLDRFAPKDLAGKRITTEVLRMALNAEQRGKQPEWLRAEAIPTLTQLLMHEEASVRLLLVELLAEIPQPAASVALAQRAVFDLAPEVREAARQALRARPVADVRPVFLQGLRYPWAPAAGHAAEALVVLQDRAAAALLVSLLGEPDPAAPSPGTGRQTVVREVVRLKHVENCLTCHPPALTPRDPVPGQVPGVSWQKFTPVVRRTTNNVTGQVTNPTGGLGGLGGLYGGGGGSSTSTVTVQVPGMSRSVKKEETPLVIRADITYLRQDFSAQLFTQLPGVPAGIPLGAPLRYDFVIRSRVLRPSEAARLKQKHADQPTYEQREAVLYALRELTGKDAGPATEDWLRLFPEAQGEAAARHGRPLVEAPPARREAVLRRLKEEEGATATYALAWAVARLKGSAQGQAREALAERLGRLPADRLRGLLHDADREVRRAAIAASAARKEAALAPDLVALLQDPQPLLAEKAHAALRQLTGQDFGPADDAPPDDRSRAVAAWRAWLAE
jgi:hypothetical protein